ncbi:MAG TPA: Fe-S cluster assembly protein SufD, partial [Thermoanaerobaculia bacterium]|nr:Fe-S cluster assembly protein SufD [Thermoanaerobaculia bacterium]
MSGAVESGTLATIREQAALRFRQLGWPSPKLEEWQYTSLAPLQKRYESGFARAESVPQTVETHGFSMEGRAVAELVFWNGRPVGSRRAGEGAGADRAPALSVYATDDDTDPIVAKYFAKYADHQRHPLTALNTANATAIAIVEAREPVEGFVHILRLGEDGYESHPRTIVFAAPGSQIVVVETFAGSGTYFTNAVTEIVAAGGAVVDHYKIECESDGAFHIGTVQIHQERSSSVTQRCISFGGGLVRNEVNVRLAGEGASVVLDGLYVAGGSQHIDNQTTVDHAVPRCESLELYKGVLDGSSRGVFDGRIIVRPDARKTVSRQTNHNLILSETAIVDSKPTLEIHNDDVKCHHGSTIGRLDEEALFYLRSRGIGEEEARGLLVLAFAGEIIDRMKVEPVREQARRMMFRQMPARLPERRNGGRTP